MQDTIRNQDACLKYHIGRLCYSTYDQDNDANSFDLRVFWYPNAEAKNPVHTRRGKKILVTEIEPLKEKIEEAENVWPGFENVQLCFHENQLGVYQCDHCNTLNPYLGVF